MVELPSKPHLGRSRRAGTRSNDLIRVLPRSSGMGFLPSSQMYSSLYFVILSPWNKRRRKFPESLASRAVFTSIEDSMQRIQYFISWRMGGAPGGGKSAHRAGAKPDLGESREVHEHRSLHHKSKALRGLHPGGGRRKMLP